MILKKIIFGFLLIVLAQTTFAQTTSNDWVKSAIEKKNKGDDTGAITDCNKALQIDPKNAWAFNVRGIAKKILERYTEAIEDFDRAIAIDSKYDIVYYNRGNAKIALEMYTDAIFDFDQAIALNPKSASNYFSRGLAKIRMGRFADAIIDYDQDIKLEPKNASAYNNRGWAKDNLGYYEKAIVDCDKAIELDPSNANSLNSRGYTKFKLGLYQEAITDFNRAIDLNAKDALNFNYRGYVYLRMGGNADNYRRAIADFDKSIELGGPRNSEPFFKYRKDAVSALNSLPDHPVVSQQTFTVITWVKPGLADLKDNVYETPFGTLPIWVRVNSSQPIRGQDINLLINGQYQPGNKTRLIDFHELNQSKSFGNSSVFQYEYKSTIDLPDGMSTYRITYNNEKTDEVKVNYQPQGLNLYVLSIGTHNVNLDFPEKDAADVAAMFTKQGGAGKIYRMASVKQLIGADATAGNMAGQLSEMARQPFNSNDVLLVFISSHGFIRNDQLKITGSDFTTTKLNQTSLDFNDDVLGKLSQANCKKFIFLDACYSGVATGKDALPVDISKAIDAMKSAVNDFTIITSSSNDEKSWEDRAWQNGAFTKAIKEALLKGKADANNDHIVTVDELYSYISRQVPAMVQQVKNEQQHPKIYNRKGDVPIFVY